jgi:hypothetical protein
MLIKDDKILKFNPKRDFKLITPCCNRTNKDGKFSNYINIAKNYGYCHSCGVATLPPTTYTNEKGEEFIWDELDHRYNTNSIVKDIVSKTATNCNEIKTVQKFISEDVIWKYFHKEPENNLLKYLRKQFGDAKVQDAKEMYAIGTTLDAGTVFWNINSKLQVQKTKVSYYNESGKRTDKFKVPYKNTDGYYACLFGEHLLSYNYYKNSTVILVESEKTAIVGYILMPQFVWLSYGGCNGLTTDKTNALKDFRVLLVPDLSEVAISIATKKVIELRQKGIDIKLWDMTDGRTDEELKLEGVYNCDLEDYFRSIKNDEINLGNTII